MEYIMKRVICFLSLAAVLILAACSSVNHELTGPGEETIASFEETKTIEPSIATEPETEPEASDPIIATAPETEPETTEPEIAIPEAYTALLDKYSTALSEGATGDMLIRQELNYMVVDCYADAPLERIGYSVVDINQDGTPEMIVGTMPVVDDAFYGKLIFDLYTFDQTGSCIKVFSSGERNRYYYAGDIKFANVGSDGAAYDFVTTLKLEDGEMIDMTYTTDPVDYVQMELTPFSQWRN